MNVGICYKDLIRQVEKLDKDRKTSLVVRVFDDLAKMTHQSQPQTSAIDTVKGEHLKHEEGDDNQAARRFDDEPECKAW